MILRLFLSIIAAIGLVTPALAQSPAPVSPPSPAPRTVAIFVENRAGAELADKTAALEDLVASRITADGLSVIARDTAVNALASVSPGGTPTPADQLLATQTTALRLAQNLNANYLLAVTLVSYGIDARAFSGYGVDTVNRIATLRVSYRLCDASRGGSLVGDSLSVSETVPQTVNIAVNAGDLVNKLIDEAATALANSFIVNTTPANLPAVAAPGQVQFSISCSMADIVLPDIQAAPNHQYIITPLAYTVEPLDVTVELNGLTLGSAPGNFTGLAGISKLRLSRQGFKTQELTVNLSAGFNLKVALQLDDQGYARWQQSLAYLQGLKQDAQITDADADRIRGIAQMFQQSGLRLDERITATSLPPVQQVYPSLLSMPAPVWGAPAAAPNGAPSPAPAPAPAK